MVWSPLPTLSPSLIGHLASVDVKQHEKCGVVDYRTQAAESVKNGDHSRRTAAIRFYFLSCRQFSAHTKSSRSRIDNGAGHREHTLSLQ